MAVSSKWSKILLFLGFGIALAAFFFIGIERFHVEGFISGIHGLLSPTQQYFGQTEESQQFLDEGTQVLAKPVDLSADSVDQKNFQRLVQSCLSGKDCVHSIDAPQFVSAYQSAKFLKADDLVLGVVFENAQKKDELVKAYPVKIMNWHEVVNDFMDKTPVVVSYDPLSGSSHVYSRDMSSKTVEFGVSGFVLNSNVVLYDRQSGSLWSQFDGVALTGPDRGKQLQSYPSSLMKWSDWVKKYPRTLVLAPDPGFTGDYNTDPYGDYQASPEVYFPLEHQDQNLGVKDIVYGIKVGDSQKIYPQAELQKGVGSSGRLNDNFKGKQLALVFDATGLTVHDAVSGEAIPVFSSFYFVWDAFYPDSDIFRAPS